MTDPKTIDSNHIETRCIFADGYTLSSDFCRAIACQVEEIVPALIPDASYTLEMLCGEAFWARLSNGERRMAGRCMAQLVVNSKLPLCFADSRHEYPKYYRLK